MLQYNYSFDEKDKEQKFTKKNGSTILSSNTPIQRHTRRAATAPSSGGSIHSSSNGGSSNKMDSQFDSLKREATKLERNLEDKVARYQQVSFK